MDELTKQLKRIYNAIYIWCEWGIMTCCLAFAIPYFILIACFLVVLPFLYLAFAIQAPFWGAVYLIVVAALSACVIYAKYFSGDDDGPRGSGRRVYDEDDFTDSFADNYRDRPRTRSRIVDCSSNRKGKT
jgi:hypothetical protein